MAGNADQIINAVIKQNARTMADMTELVRVTLTAPYKGEDHAIAAMRGGSTEAIIPDGGGFDEVNDLTRKPRTIIPGRPVHYHLAWKETKLEKCACGEEGIVENAVVMPMPYAKLYFGNWDVFHHVAQPGELLQTDMTPAAERQRVAFVWGGYKMGLPHGQDETSRGVFRRMVKGAPPDVPRVEIRRMDAMGRVAAGEPLHDPWKAFFWEKDCDPSVLRQEHAARPGLVTVTEAELAKMIAAEVKKAMKGTAA